MIYVLHYIAFTLLIFIMSFFIGVFIQYIKTKTIIPRKMFTYKKGGMFEYYKIVLPLVLIILSLHLIFKLDPFEGDNWLASIVNYAPLTIVTYIFLVFIFIFTFYFITYLYIKIFKIKDRKEFYNAHTHKMVMTSLVLSFIIVVSMVLTAILSMIAAGSAT